MWKLVPALDARDGPGLSGARPRRGADRRDAEARGDALPQDAGARPRDPRRGDQGAQARRQARGRDRVHALRHLRLSARPHAGRAAARAASASTSRPSTPRWSASARRRAPPGRAPARPRPRRSGSRLREKLGATEFLGYETESAEGVVAALVRDGKEVAELKAGESRRGGRQPDAVLWRVRRPGRRHRRDDAPTACASRVTDTQKKAGDLFVHHRQGRAGHAQGRRGARARGRSRAPQRDPPQPFGDASAARGAAPGARRSRRAEGLAGRARSAALRLLASQADDAPRRSSGSRTWPTTSCCRIRRSPRG